MSGGGRPPHSAPSLPLNSAPSVPLESLQTPDTSSLFLSSLGSHAAPHATEFTSLEDLLNFSGISHQTPSSSSSLEALARDLEQKEAGVPAAKRLCTDITSSSSSVHTALTVPAHVTLAPSTTVTSSTPPAVLVSPLPAATAPVPLFLQQRTATASLRRQPATGCPPSATITPKLVGSTHLSGTATVRIQTGNPSPTLSLIPSLTTSPLTPITTVTSSPATTTSLVVPSVLAHIASPKPSTLPASSSTTGSTKTNPAISIPSLPSNPTQRALLVQLVQAYRQCAALGDAQGQTRIKTQLNILLQAQQKLATTYNANNNTLHSKPVVSPQVSVLPTPILATSNSSTPVSLPSHSPLSNSGKGVEPVSMVSTATNSLLSHNQGVRPALLGPPSTSPPDTTVTSLAPIPSNQPRATGASGSATALKAAALYNLRLKQLQLFLQSLPEDQRPHSIPELKALLQRSGGPLGALAQTPPVSSTGASLTAAPVPTLLSSAAPVPTFSQPTVGQCLPQLTQHSPAHSVQISIFPTPTFSSSSLLPHSTGSLTPTILSRPTGTQFSQTTPLISAAPPTTSKLPTMTIGTTGAPLPTTGTTVVPQMAGGTTTVPQVTTGITSVPQLTTGSTFVPQLTTAGTGVPQLTTGNTGSTVPQPTTGNAGITRSNKTPPPNTVALQPTTVPVSDTAKPLTSSSSDPIKPGVPTPLPPGVNPETLAVLCRMPDSELQKLNLPTVLMTAIRVWRGQHSSSLQRGRKPANSQALPIIIPSSQPSSSSQLQPTVLYQSSSAPQPPPSSVSPLFRPVTRHQTRAEQTKAEKDRLAALNKVLQSSEEARIAYRFNMLREKMTNQLMAPDSNTPFKSLHDVIARLLPYHMWSEAEPPPGAIEKADAVYESVAQVLMSRSQGLMSNYQHLIYHDARRDSESVMMVSLERLFQESERERREQEDRQSQQAAQVAADLSLIAGALGTGRGPLSGLDFDAEFAFGDVMNADPMLTFEPGIT